MTLQDLHIGKEVYFIRKDGKVITSKITSIDSTGSVSVDISDYNNYPVRFQFNRDKIHYRSSYSNENELYITYNKSDAAILKRKIVIETLQKLKTILNESFERVKRHREKNWDVLNTDDVDKWITEFEKNNQW
jgi:hypothetical protein